MFVAKNKNVGHSEFRPSDTKPSLETVKTF